MIEELFDDAKTFLLDVVIPFWIYILLTVAFVIGPAIGILCLFIWLFCPAQ